MLGDDQKRLAVKELIVSFFATPLAVAAFALLIGFGVGPRWSRRSFAGSSCLVVIAFVAYVLCTNYSRTIDESRSLREFGDLTGRISWWGLFFSGGILGPALSRDIVTALVFSVAATLSAATMGAFLMIFFACALAGDCL